VNDAGDAYTLRSSDALTLLREFESSFDDVYLTLVSVLQGAILALLLEKAEDLLTHPLSTGMAVPGLMVIAQLMIIVVFWNEYRLGVTLYRWVPTMRDATIPFALATAQSMGVFCLDHPSRCLLIQQAAFYLLALVGFWNLYAKAVESGLNRPALSFTVRFMMWDFGSCLLSVAALAVAAIAVPAEARNSPFAAVLIATVACVQLFRQWRNWHLALGTVRQVAGNAASVELEPSAQPRAIIHLPRYLPVLFRVLRLPGRGFDATIR
jgi:hypothetical protein